jgi:hypothetical protein
MSRLRQAQRRDRGADGHGTEPRSSNMGMNPPKSSWESMCKAYMITRMTKEHHYETRLLQRFFQAVMETRAHDIFPAQGSSCSLCNHAIVCAAPHEKLSNYWKRKAWNQFNSDIFVSLYGTGHHGLVAG